MKLRSDLTAEERAELAEQARDLYAVDRIREAAGLREVKKPAAKKPVKA